MPRPKLPERVSMTVRISPKLMEKIDTAVADLQESGESSVTKGGFVERLLIAALQQIEEDKRDKKQVRLSV